MGGRTHALWLLTIAGLLTGGAADAKPNRIEAEGTLVSIPAGKGRRVGVRNAQGTVWLARPTRPGFIAKLVFHRLQRLPIGSHVKLSGALLSTDPLRMGPDTIGSGDTKTLELTVSKDGKTATWAGRTVRLHPLSSIPDNSPSGTATTGRAGLLKAIRGKRVRVKGFTFSDARGLPTDVFLDEVQAATARRTSLLAYTRADEPEQELLPLAGQTPVWIHRIAGAYAEGQYVTDDGRGNTTANGGRVRLRHLRFALPEPAPGAATGARGKLERSGD